MLSVVVYGIVAVAAYGTVDVGVAVVGAVVVGAD